jgi:KUP system potassium uptake protein
VSTTEGTGRPQPAASPDVPSESAGGAGDVAAEAPASKQGAGAVLALGALGVVFGDIGTSPLYALQTVFSIDHNNVKPTPVDVFGVISMVIWAITIVVSVKYVALVMRADNDGEGGILALVALLREKLLQPRRLAVAMTLGMFGAALFYGDSVITPAISVMSAIEGVVVVNPSLKQLVLPVSVVVLTVLFVVQRWGTEAVGKAFGPVMTVWFVVLAVLGLPHIVRHPEILAALSPTYALAFVVEHPFTAFVAMGAVVLTITGAEALYADMGHFGARPIRTAWYAVVFPALALNYFGQGAMILHEPATIDNPFFNLAPSWATLPLVVLATLATVIASQAVISGAYSVSRQAVRLGLFPRLSVKHTPARHRVRPRGHRDARPDEPAVPAARSEGVALGDVEDRRLRRRRRAPRGHLLRGEPHEGRQRGLAAVAHRRRRRHPHDDVAQGCGHPRGAAHRARRPAR